MTTKHTPGPWKYIALGQMVETAEPVNMRREYGHICDLREPVNVADAALIAAAPELLEACKQLIGVIGAHEMDSRDCDRRGGRLCNCLAVATALARAAIAKALGKDHP